MADRHADLKRALRAFARARGWERYHQPKNLAMAMSVEAAELVEIFQWLTPAQARALPPEKRRHLEEEIADVFLYLLRLADFYGVDVAEAACAKMRKNAVKYPPRRRRLA
jgi:NTP pyrophosphatase (non-canonical NTP hydrolase)